MSYEYLWKFITRFGFPFLAMRKAYQRGRTVGVAESSVIHLCNTSCTLMRMNVPVDPQVKTLEKSSMQGATKSPYYLYVTVR